MKRWAAVVGVVLAVLLLPTTAWAETTPPTAGATTGASSTETPTDPPTDTPTDPPTETVTVTSTVTAEPSGPVEVAPVLMDEAQFGALGVVLVLLLGVTAASFVVGLRR